MTPPRVLHLAGSFADNDLSWRMAQVMAGFDARHSLVADDGNTAGAVHFPPGLKVTTPPGFPSLSMTVNPAKLTFLARWMAQYDLILTYGAAGLTGALARTLFGQAAKTGPLVHHELEPFSGESGGFRRKLALARASAVIVADEETRRRALSWVGGTTGVALAPLAGPVPTAGRRAALPRVVKRKGELWLGHVGPVGGDPGRLLDKLDQLDERWQLVLVNGGAEAAAVRGGALARETVHRVHCVDGIAAPQDAFALFDLFLDPLSPAGPRRFAAGARAAGLAVADLDALPRGTTRMAEKTANPCDPASLANMVAAQIAVYRQVLDA